MTELNPTKSVPDPSDSAQHLFPSQVFSVPPIPLKDVPPPPTIAPDTERKEETSRTNSPILHTHKTCSDLMYDKVLPLAFWFALHALVIAYLFVADTQLSQDLDGKGPGPHLARTAGFVTLILAAGALFLRTSLMDPGVIKGIPKEDMEKERLNSSEPVDPTARFCPVCNHWQKLRSKHCRLCQHCVAKYDHHCYWMGACIGERNHASFWWFLLTQSVVLVWAIYMVIDSIHQSQWATAEEFLKQNIVGLLLCIKMFIVGWLPIALLGFHSYLICTNQTTWEFNMRARITYLRPFPDSFNPFSQGCCGNIELSCCDFDPEPKYWRPYMKTPSKIADTDS